MTSMTHRQETLIARPPNTLGGKEVEDGMQTPTPENNTQGLGEQIHSSNEATKMYPQRQASPT